VAVANNGGISGLLSYGGGGKNKKGGMAFVKTVLDLLDLSSATKVVWSSKSAFNLDVGFCSRGAVSGAVFPHFRALTCMYRLPEGSLFIQ